MKRANGSRALALILAAMMLPLASCAANDDTPDSHDTSSAQTDTSIPVATSDVEVETVDISLVDELPEGLNFENAEFTFFTRERDFYHGAINVEDSSGENLNDALYDRARAIEDRLGVVFKEVMSTDTSAAKTSIQGGDDTYKVVTGRNVHTVQYASQGLAYKWDQVKYIDLTKDYWYDSINENLTINNVIFTAAGAYNLTSYDYTHVLMFNKDMITDLGLEDPYTLVKNGEWTFDKFEEFGVTATRDLNGDGASTLDDQYGFVSGAKQVSSSFWIAAGEQGIKKNENDIPEYTMATDENFNAVLLDIFELMWDTGLWYPEDHNDNVPESSITLFSENQALMMDATFYYVEQFREMEADFGILPYPKYTVEQENYLSRIEGCELPMIPSSLSQDDADMAGAVLEALSSYSQTNTIPVYYEVYLKTKNVRDAESAEMFDIIFANRVFDLSDTIWCDEIRDNFIRTMFVNNNRNMTSVMKKSTNSIKKSIDSIVKGFES